MRSSEVADGLLRARQCLLLVFVFLCSIDLSSTIDVRATRAIVEPPLRHPSSLTNAQRSSAVTIEFSLNGIDKNNSTAVRIVYLETRRKILELLNRRKTTITSPGYSTSIAVNTTTVSTASTFTSSSTTTTAAATTTSTSASTSTPYAPTSTVTTSTTFSTNTSTPATAAIPSTIAASTTPATTAKALTTTPTTSSAEVRTQTPTIVSTKQCCEAGPERKRRKRKTGGNKDTFTEDDLLLIDDKPQFDENGNLRIPIILVKEESGDLDLTTGELEAELHTIVNVYKGLPRELSPVETPQLDLNVWLPTLLSSCAFLLVFIFIFVRCWKTTRNKKTGDEWNGKDELLI